MPLELVQKDGYEINDSFFSDFATLESNPKRLSHETKKRSDRLKDFLDHSHNIVTEQAQPVIRSVNPLQNEIRADSDCRILRKLDLQLTGKVVYLAAFPVAVVKGSDPITLEQVQQSLKRILKSRPGRRVVNYVCRIGAPVTIILNDRKLNTCCVGENLIGIDPSLKQDILTDNAEKPRVLLSLERTLLHELGHLLGIGDSQRVIDEIENPGMRELGEHFNHVYH